MPSWSVKIIADTVTPKVAAFPGKLEREVENQLDPVGEDMVDLARELVRVRTGYLRSTIFYHVSGFVLEFGAEADYAAPQEFGTRFMLGQPYIRPALDAFSQRIPTAVLQGALNALEV